MVITLLDEGEPTGTKAAPIRAFRLVPLDED